MDYTDSVFYKTKHPEVSRLIKSLQKDTTIEKPHSNHVRDSNFAL
jgi:hypothetical protein